MENQNIIEAEKLIMRVRSVKSKNGYITKSVTIPTKSQLNEGDYVKIEKVVL